MNKTIIINMNGIVFHIEEGAYEILKAYMSDVKRHFANSQDSDEIVGDIESRIAEMFAEMLQEDKKQAIVLPDVEKVIAQMGSVNEFADGDEGEFTAPADPRIGKKLYRDGDDRIIGGVCAGIAHYFDADPRTIRILAVILFFAAGTGFMAYIILWLAMPKAKTRAEKMAMKGEQINIQNIKRNFDDEVEALKHNFSKAREHARPAIDDAGSFLRDLFGHLGRFIEKAAKLFIKFIGVMIILCGIGALTAALIGLFAVMGVWNARGMHAFPFNVLDPAYSSELYFSAFVIIFIPIVALVLFAIRILFNRKVVSRTGTFAMLIIWLTGLGVGVYYGSRLAADFSEEATFAQTIDLAPSPVYYLNLNETRFLTKADSAELDIADNDQRSIQIGEDDLRGPDNLNLQIEKSNVDKPVLIEEFTARGSNFKSAFKYAKRVIYKFSQQDSILSFDWAAHIPDEDLYRAQEVRLKLLVPLNTRLIIDGKLNHYLDFYNLQDCIPDNMPKYSTPSAWIMSMEGLKCMNDSVYQSHQNPDSM